VVGTNGNIYFGAGDRKLYALKGSSPLANSPWPMFHRDAQHTGRIPRFSFKTPTWLGARGLALSFDIDADKRLTIETSTNLVDWLSLTNLTPAGVEFQFIDSTAADFAQRFYRAVSE